MSEVKEKRSPNFGPRAAGASIDMIILHYTGMPDAEAALSWLVNPASQVSSHYIVFEDGQIYQLVDDSQRAWHAGVSYWAGETDINSRSIGIEIVNPGHEFGYRGFPDRQIDAVIDLVRGLVSRFGIPPGRILGHSDVAPGRKQDPGELFPWERLAEEGLGIWTRPAPIVAGPVLQLGDQGAAVRELRAEFSRFGYQAGHSEEFDAGLEAIVAAFQRHFRPIRVDGVADPSTVATLKRLLSLGQP
jgi:N-acetylmuramoyl-L-alanine amidase